MKGNAVFATGLLVSMLAQGEINRCSSSPDGKTYFTDRPYPAATLFQKYSFSNP